MNEIDPCFSPGAKDKSDNDRDLGHEQAERWIELGATVTVTSLGQIESRRA